MPHGITPEVARKALAEVYMAQKKKASAPVKKAVKKAGKRLRKPTALELLQRRVEAMDASLVHVARESHERLDLVNSDVGCTIARLKKIEGLASDIKSLMTDVNSLSLRLDHAFNALGELTSRIVKIEDKLANSPETNQWTASRVSDFEQRIEVLEGAEKSQVDLGVSDNLLRLNKSLANLERRVDAIAHVVVPEVGDPHIGDRIAAVSLKGAVEVFKDIVEWGFSESAEREIANGIRAVVEFCGFTVTE